MASQSTGIQQLLVAEKRAAEKVGEARKRKARRLKQAKEEAQAEVDAYRKERERQYQEHEKKLMGSKGDVQVKMDEETHAQVSVLTQQVTKNKEKAMQRLLTLVCTIEPELHRNLRAG